MQARTQSARARTYFVQKEAFGGNYMASVLVSFRLGIPRHHLRDADNIAPAKAIVLQRLLLGDGVQIERDVADDPQVQLDTAHVEAM